MFDRETRREKILDGRMREMKLKEKNGSNKVFNKNERISDNVSSYII